MELNNPSSNSSVGHGTSSGTTSDSCCFKLCVFDAHDPDVSDTSEEFCLEPTAAALASSLSAGGESIDLGSGEELGATLEVVKSPPALWELGTPQEVYFFQRQNCMVGFSQMTNSWHFLCDH